MQILLANPRGFCAGVDRAIDIVERAIELFGAPIYVRHEVVHNRYVVERLRSLGAVFVEELDEVPDDATVIFSAHGVSRAVQDEARRRALKVFDATCPLVTKVHMEVARYAREGREVILIGHAGHPEVEGTMGQFDTAFGGRILLVETPEDVERLESRSGAARVRHADDAVGRRHAADRRCAAHAVPDARQSAQGRHLLRDAEPPGRGEATGRALRRHPRRRLAEQLELESPARDRREGRHPGLSRRRSGGPAARMVRGQARRRRDRRRIGAGSAGASASSRASASGAGQRPSTCSASPRTSSSACRASCAFAVPGEKNRELSGATRTAAALSFPRFFLPAPLRITYEAVPASGADQLTAITYVGGLVSVSRVIVPSPLGSLRSTSSSQHAASRAAMSCGS